MSRGHFEIHSLRFNVEHVLSSINFVMNFVIFNVFRSIRLFIIILIKVRVGLSQYVCMMIIIHFLISTKCFTALMGECIFFSQVKFLPTTAII
jgi:hypothetical protein